MRQLSGVTRISDLVRGLGGMAQKQQLVRLGARDAHLTYAVSSGDVTRVRNGWYSTLEPQDPHLRAVRVGGRLTGLSLIHALGGWVEHRPPLHVSLPVNASRMRTQHNRFRRLAPADSGGVVLHWENRELAGRGTSTAVALIDALVRVVLDEQLEVAVACLDWALNSGRLDRIDFERMLLRLPAELQGIGDWTDATCQSLPESLSRTRFRLAGHEVISQVELTESGEFIDLVVDGTAGVEVDGEEYHLTRFERDRRKDLRIIAAHLHPVRPSARMVFTEWPSVLEAVQTALADRGRPPARPLGNSGFPHRARSRRKARGSRIVQYS